MSKNEERLLEIFKERSFKRGTFRLASGATSDYYIDGRMTAVHSKGAYLIGEVLYERTKDLDVNAIGGLQVGAVPDGGGRHRLPSPRAPDGRLLGS